MVEHDWLSAFSSERWMTAIRILFQWWYTSVTLPCSYSHLYFSQASHLIRHESSFEKFDLHFYCANLYLHLAILLVSLTFAFSFFWEPLDRIPLNRATNLLVHSNSANDYCFTELFVDTVFQRPYFALEQTARIFLHRVEEESCFSFKTNLLSNF